MGCCLPTTGASNGQTIAGAVSTGTHGSALRVGAMQDYVRALHIVTSETEHFIVQPSSNPIVSKKLSDIFGAQLITNDDIFYSALVSFGSFGIIHGVIVETQSLFQLETYCVRTDYNKLEKVYSILAALKPSDTNTLVPFLQEQGIPCSEDPHHLDIIINPYSAGNNAFFACNV